MFETVLRLNYEGESVSRSQMDKIRVIFELGKEHLIPDISTIITDTRQRSETHSTEVF
jgi:hypothetical protein